MNKRFLNENIRVLREANGKIQQQIADHLGVPQSTYNHWEQQTTPKKIYQMMLCEYYGITIEQLNNQDLSKSNTSQLKIKTNHTPGVLIIDSNINSDASRLREANKKLEKENQELRDAIVAMSKEFSKKKKKQLHTS